MTIYEKILYSKYKKIIKKIEILNKRNVKGYKTFAEYCFANKIMIGYFNELKVLEKRLPFLQVDSYEKFESNVFNQLKGIYNKKINNIFEQKNSSTNNEKIIDALKDLKNDILNGYGYKCDKMLDFFIKDIDSKIKNNSIENQEDLELKKSDVSIKEKSEIDKKKNHVLKLEHSFEEMMFNYEFPTIELLAEENEIKDVIQSKEYIESKSKIIVALKDDSNTKIIDIHETSHILIAGTTGIGKTTLLDNIIMNILYKSKPTETKFIIFDTNNNGLRLYNGIPHLLMPVITDAKVSIGALAWIVQEIDNRSKLFIESNTQDLTEYNDKQKNKNNVILPEIIVIIDEILDIANNGKDDVEDALIKITKQGEKVGVYLIITTNRPSTDIISGFIKANIYTRVSFYLPARMDSKMILDVDGAEKIKNRGDILLKTIGVTIPKKYHCPYISINGIKNVVEFLNKKGYSDNNNILEIIEENNNRNKETINLELEDENPDPFLNEAINTVVETRQASTSFIQRRFKVGYARAGRIIDQMEERGVISGYYGSKPREVLWTIEKLAEMKSKK